MSAGACGFEVPLPLRARSPRFYPPPAVLPEVTSRPARSEPQTQLARACAAENSNKQFGPIQLQPLAASAA